MAHFLKRWRGPLYMSAGMLLWAIIEDIAHFFSRPYTSFEIVWMRYTVHLLFMLAVWGPRRGWGLLRTRQLGGQLTRGLLMMGMHLTFIFAVKMVAVDDVMWVFWVAPFLMALFARGLNERMNALGWVMTLVAYGGAWLVLRPGEGVFRPATLLALGMAACFSAYLVFSRRLRSEDIQVSLFYTAFSVWVVLGLGLPWYWVTPTWVDMGLMAAIGLVGYIGLYVFDKAVEDAPVPAVAPFALTQPMFAVAVNWVMLGIVPGKRAWLGSALIAASLFWWAWQTRPTTESTS